MTTRTQVVEILYGVMDEINAQQPADGKLARAETTVLYGDGAALDSLALVNLVIEAETALGDRLGLMLPLADTIMSGEKSPPRTVGELADFVLTLT